MLLEHAVTVPFSSKPASDLQTAGGSFEKQTHFLSGWAKQKEFMFSTELVFPKSVKSETELRE